MGSYPTALILASDHETVTGSRTAKLQHPVLGQPVLAHTLEAVSTLDLSETVVILADQEDKLSSAITGPDVSFLDWSQRRESDKRVLQLQEETNGDPLLVIPGNQPLVETKTLSTLLRRHTEDKADLSILSVSSDDYRSYLRGNRYLGDLPDDGGQESDVHQRTPVEGRVFTNIYCLRNDSFLWEALSLLSADRLQGWFGLSDLLGRYRSEGRKVSEIATGDCSAALSIDSQFDLAFADRVLRLRNVGRLMDQGVRVIDPERTYIENNVTVGQDTIVFPDTHLVGDTSIEADCVVGPDTWIDSSRIERKSVIRYSVVESARVRANSQIGPYAHLRPQSDVGPQVRVGNFVEVKASRLARGVKAGHLAYLGDTQVGEETNIGAGAITCNYDGTAKHRTKIEKQAFLGSNCSLVAPICIGEGAVIGAGSTITRDVPPHTLALGRSRQINKPQEEGK